MINSIKQILIGKVISKVEEINDYKIKLHFTDGTILEIFAASDINDCWIETNLE